MKIISFVLFAPLLSVAGCPGLVLAADIYKCPLENGSFDFSDRPCQNAATELYYKETEEDKQRRAEYDLQREVEAQKAAQQAVIDASRNHMGILIKAGKIRDAREHATQNGLENDFDGLVSDFVGNLIATQKQLSNENEALDRALTDRANIIDKQQRSLKSQDEHIGFLHSDLSRCRGQLATPINICP